jgi:hypothetical protein
MWFKENEDRTYKDFNHLSNSNQKIMILGGISLVGKTKIWYFTGGVDSLKYIDCLEKCVIPAGKEIFKNNSFSIVHDNARAHISKLTTQYLKEKKIYSYDHPPKSPDLNPVEHCWSMMKNYIKKCEVKNIPHLKSLIDEAWNKVDLECMANMIKHLYKVILQVIEDKGDIK